MLLQVELFARYSAYQMCHFTQPTCGCINQVVLHLRLVVLDDLAPRGWLSLL